MVVSIKFESNQDYQTEAITAVTGIFAGVDSGSLGQVIGLGINVGNDSTELFQDVVYGNRLPVSSELTDLVQGNITRIQSRMRKDQDDNLQPIVQEAMRQPFVKDEFPTD